MENKNIAFDKSPSMRTVDDNGYLHVAVTPISKATVNPYLGREIPGWEEQGLKPDAIYYGLRDPDELKKAAPTFNGLPLLLNHHEESAANPQKDFRVGSTGTDAFFDGEYLKNSLSITDQKAIDLINSGDMKELSCAYFFEPEFKAGEYKGMPYDFVMRNIRGNHVALVPEGRAGHDVAVADSKPKKEGKATVRKKTLAKDANEAIERAEVDAANFAKCIQAVEAQGEGIDPATIGLPEVTAETTIPEIVDIYMKDIDEDTRAHKIEYLTYMANYNNGDSCIKDEDGGAQPANPMPPTEPAKDDDWLDEKMKDPNFKEAFEMGIRYGERREKDDPNRIDRDHEREGEERYLHSVGDSAERIKESAKKEVMNHVKALTAAARECRAYIGETDPLAFDSAEDIYALALRQAGYNPSEFKRSSLRDMVAVINREKKAKQPFAADSAIFDDDLPDDIKKYL